MEAATVAQPTDDLGIEEVGTTDAPCVLEMFVAGVGLVVGVYALWRSTR